MASRKQYFAIKNALTKNEKKLIELYEFHWYLKTYVPTIQEVAEKLELPQTEVNFMLTRREVQKALDNRGIKWRQHSQEGLTATQIAAAQVMMNFTDTRSNEQKLDELGIQPATYYAWLDDPQFKNLVNSFADRNKLNVRPTAVAEFNKLISKGDWNAIKYFLDVTGEFKGNDAPQSEVLITMLVEIIQDEIKDPELIMRIAQRFKLAASNRTLEVATQPAQYAIPAQPLSAEDVSLEQARKTLGI